MFLRQSFSSPNKVSSMGIDFMNSSKSSILEFRKPERSFIFFSTASLSTPGRNESNDKIVPIYDSTPCPVMMDTNLFFTAPYAIFAPFTMRLSSSFSTITFINHLPQLACCICFYDWTLANRRANIWCPIQLHMPYRRIPPIPMEL